MPYEKSLKLKNKQRRENISDYRAPYYEYYWKS